MTTQDNSEKLNDKLIGEFYDSMSQDYNMITFTKGCLKLMLNKARQQGIEIGRKMLEPNKVIIGFGDGITVEWKPEDATEDRIKALDKMLGNIKTKAYAQGKKDGAEAERKRIIEELKYMSESGCLSCPFGLVKGRCMEHGKKGLIITICEEQLEKLKLENRGATLEVHNSEQNVKHEVKVCEKSQEPSPAPENEA